MQWLIASSGEAENYTQPHTNSFVLVNLPTLVSYQVKLR